MDFMQFAESHGLIIKNLTQGRIVRCATQSHRMKRNGAFFFDGAWGWLQDWQRHDAPVIWKSDQLVNDHDIQKRIKISKQEYRRDREIENTNAAKKAEWILSQCSLSEHSYLIKKGYPELMGNVWETDDSKVLVIPMYKDKKIVGCQLIDEQGNKKFLKGQSTKGAYFQIGDGSKTVLVEGYASALSLKKILTSMRVSYTILVAFSANNLKQLLAYKPCFVVADNDASRTGEKAAVDTRLPWWMPPIEGMDINDYHMTTSTFKLTQELKRVFPK